MEMCTQETEKNSLGCRGLFHMIKTEVCDLMVKVIVESHITFVNDIYSTAKEFFFNVTCQ